MARAGDAVLWGCVLLVAACGSGGESMSAGAPASISDVPATASPGTAAPEVADTTPLLVPAESTTNTPATHDVVVATAPPGPGSTAFPPGVPVSTRVGSGVPLGGVTIDDPLPPQADASSDAAVAEAAVRYAYQHWILVDLDADVRAAIVENGERNRDVIDAGLEGARSIVELARIAVDEVVFTDPASADVLFRVQWNDGSSPYFPDPRLGRAVYADGSWRIAGRTLCLIAFGSGQDCAGAGADNPASPTALMLTAVPAGYSAAGESSVVDDTFPVGSAGLWASRTGDLLTISAEALAGVSALAPEDAEAVLRSTRYGVGDAGTATSIAGRAAIVSAGPDGAGLVFVRGDDLVIRMHANDLDANALVGLAAALVAMDGPPLVDVPAATVPVATAAFAFCGEAAVVLEPDGGGGEVDASTELHIDDLFRLAAAADLGDDDRQRFARAVTAVRHDFDRFRSDAVSEWTDRPAVDVINDVCSSEHAWRSIVE